MTGRLTAEADSIWLQRWVVSQTMSAAADLSAVHGAIIAEYRSRQSLAFGEENCSPAALARIQRALDEGFHFDELSALLLSGRLFLDNRGNVRRRHSPLCRVDAWATLAFSFAMIFFWIFVASEARLPPDVLRSLEMPEQSDLVVLAMGSALMVVVFLHEFRKSLGRIKREDQIADALQRIRAVVATTTISSR